MKLLTGEIHKQTVGKQESEKLPKYPIFPQSHQQIQATKNIINQSKNLGLVPVQTIYSHKKATEKEILHFNIIHGI